MCSNLDLKKLKKKQYQYSRNFITGLFRAVLFSVKLCKIPSPNKTEAIKILEASRSDWAADEVVLKVKWYEGHQSFLVDQHLERWLFTAFCFLQSSLQTTNSMFYAFISTIYKYLCSCSKKAQKHTY